MKQLEEEEERNDALEKERDELKKQIKGMHRELQETQKKAQEAEVERREAQEALAQEAEEATAKAQEALAQNTKTKTNERNRRRNSGAWKRNPRAQGRKGVMEAPDRRMEELMGSSGRKRKRQTLSAELQEEGRKRASMKGRKRAAAKEEGVLRVSAAPCFSHAVFKAATSLKGGAADFHGGPCHCPEGGRRWHAEAQTTADNRLVGH